ncbi:hypothetical protein O9992_24715 [Vibrio lentus]|nr:hypothetical protein [Vibrio lentus]
MALTTKVNSLKTRMLGKQTPASNGFLERFINGHHARHDAYGNHWRPLNAPALTERYGW